MSTDLSLSQSEEKKVSRTRKMRNQNKNWALLELRYLEAFYPAYNTKKVASMLGRSVRSIQSTASAYGIKKASAEEAAQKTRCILAKVRGRRRMLCSVRGILAVKWRFLCVSLPIPCTRSCSSTNSVYGGGRLW